MPKKIKKLTKPILQTKTESFFDYHECIEFLEQKHNVDFRDWAKSHGHFNSWCDKKGLGQLDPEGKLRGSSQIWFAQYSKDPKGMANRPPYQDFWHFLIDLYQIHNGCVITINYLTDQDYCKEEWQKAAYKLIHDEFSNKDGDITFYISW